MKAYKGFNTDMTCRGFQYEEGKEYETDTAEVGKSGFHACEHPLECMGHYYPNESVYHEVEVGGDIDKKENETIVSATKIKIGRRLTTAEMVQAAIEYTESNTKEEAESNEDCGASSATGNCGASSATGDWGASTATGNWGASSATGYCGASTATGNWGASSATGYCGASSATGDCGASSATGNCGASTATGNCGASVTTGYKGSAEAGNITAVAVAWGYESAAKGCVGAHLVLADWRWYAALDAWILSGAKLVRVDGETIKPDTLYRYINGEVVEVTA